MREALRLARQGAGATSPNPMVGAVVVKGDEVIARGWHRRAGTPHAEAVALDRAGDGARGADLYVNLEPCCHTGKTPPCADRIVRAGVARVVASMCDPYEEVSGGGFRKLRRAGITVEVGDGGDESAKLNEAFLKRVLTGLPWVDLKMASTLDGRIADKAGKSKWITGEESRSEVHRLRREADGVLIGTGTAIADNPHLTIRAIKSAAEPLRIVLDHDLNISPRANLFSSRLDPERTILVCRADPPCERARRLESTGARLLPLAGWKAGRAPLRPLLRRLTRLGINRLLVEGGGEVAGKFLDARLVDRFHLFLAPKAIGKGVDLLSGLRDRKLNSALTMEIRSAKLRGNDLHIVLEPGGK